MGQTVMQDRGRAQLCMWHGPSPSCSTHHRNQEKLWIAPRIDETRNYTRIDNWVWLPSEILSDMTNVAAFLRPLLVT
eukprot:scaffold23504_cov32-Tisochrysis_lutea.AAC.2